MEKGSRKRSSTTEGKDHGHIKCVIAEFEDVLVASSFIKDKVHSYVSDNAENYLTDNYDKTEIKKYIESLKNEKIEGLQAISEDGNKQEVIKSVCEYTKALLSKSDTCNRADVLVMALLQKSVDKKDLKIDLYEETGKCIKAWVEKDLKVVVLTGRQQEVVHTILLGGCSGLNEADIKVESLGDKPSSVKESYVTLADKLQIPAADILFITHSQHEAVAASAAGMEATVVERDDKPKDKKTDKQTDKKTDKQIYKQTDKQEVVQSYNVVQCLEEVLKTDEIPCKRSQQQQQQPPAVFEAGDAAK